MFDQIYVRVKEVQQMIDLLEAMNDGRDVNNILGYQFDMRQMKVSNFLQKLINFKIFFLFKCWSSFIAMLLLLRSALIDAIKLPIFCSSNFISKFELCAI